jgi:hypothetical protein
MSLDSRLRQDLAAIADTVAPDTEPLLESLLARGQRQRAPRGVGPRVLAVAACLALVGGLVVWWFGRAHGHQPGLVTEPTPPSGTYTATLSGDLAGDWRLRFGADHLSVVAPDRTAIGRRAASGTYAQDASALTTDLLDDGPCSGRGSYRWSGTGDDVRLEVVDDDCALRRQILAGTGWTRVQEGRFEPGTYRTPPLTLGRMRRTALAEGFSRADVDAYLDEQFRGAEAVTYTLKAEQGIWLVTDSVDGGPQGIAWQGLFTVLDPVTVQAGTKPCGPIVYDVRTDGDAVSFVVVTDACPEPGTAPVGELIAQTTIYESAPFTRQPE